MSEAMQTGDTLLQCLAALAAGYGLRSDVFAIARKHGVGKGGAPDEVLTAIASESGLDMRFTRLSWSGLGQDDAQFPMIGRLTNGNAVILHQRIKGPDRDVVLVVDPLAATNRPFEVDEATMGSNWNGDVALVSPRKTHSLLRCFVILARNEGVDLSVDRLIHDYALGGKDPEPTRFARLAREQGFLTRERKLGWEGLSRLGQAWPVIARLKDGRSVLLTGLVMDKGEVMVDMLDPYAPHLRHETMARDQMEDIWDGRVQLVKRQYGLSEEEQPFGLRWFIPEFLRQRRAFTDVAVAAILLQVLGLAMPLFFQVVIDKVLVHQGIATLHVIGLGMLAVVAFEGIFQFFRGYILIHATNKIDIRVATRTFSRLVSLPMGFFDRISAGVLIKHLQQADRIRQFLSGKLFMTILDGFALFIFLPFLFVYSVPLALVVLGFSLITALVITILLPRFRKRLLDLYQAEGDRQSFLVESIQGMPTIKSLALEAGHRKKWDQKSAQAVTMNFRVGRISVSAGALTSTLEKLMVLSIPWIGVFLVFDGQMSVGALIAFQMIAGRVSSPLVQFVSLIHEYQETALSVRMLGSVMNQEPERDAGSRGLTPHIKGDVVFEDVSFRYTPDSRPVLVDVNLAIPSGKIIGVVGRSGSGKSTLVRLLSGIYPCREGVVRIDGYDVRDLDLVHLRRSVGMVLQDNFLFHGTVRENIGVTKSDARFEDIVRAAHYAGADEFIEKLSQGYDTVLEENGSNLSGGQRQRLAIARTLLTDPRILVFDEATSALDAESEMIVQNNLEKIAHGRTTIIISHRLSMLVKADLILVVEGGRIIASAPHEVLLDKESGCELYRNLWYSQNRHVLESPWVNY